jgi:flagellar protein FliO/FliZ
MLCASAAASAQESAPGNAVAEQLAQSSLRMVGSLLAVLALVALCAWVLRRWRDQKSVESGSIEIVSAMSLGSKDRVVLLRVANEHILVGVSPTGMRRLHVVRQPGAQASGQLPSPESSGSSAPRAVPSTFSLQLGSAQ